MCFLRISLVFLVMDAGTTFCDETASFGEPPSETLRWESFEQLYPRYVDVKDVHLTAEQREMWVDLSPYLNPSPYSIQASASLGRTFRLFRTLGLRHLCVMDTIHGDMIGIITRRNLLSEHCKDSFMRAGNSVPTWRGRLAASRSRRPSSSEGGVLHEPLIIDAEAGRSTPY